MTYFGSGGEAADGVPRIVRAADRRSFPVADGIALEPVLGGRLNINVVTLDAGAIAEVHTHDEEQIGYVVAGAVEFTDGDEVWLLEAGDSYHVEPNVPHGARALDEGCLIIDAFAPPRAGVRELLEPKP